MECRYPQFVRSSGIFQAGDISVLFNFWMLVAYAEMVGATVLLDYQAGFDCIWQEKNVPWHHVGVRFSYVLQGLP